MEQGTLDRCVWVGEGVEQGMLEGCVAQDAIWKKVPWRGVGAGGCLEEGTLEGCWGQETVWKKVPWRGVGAEGCLEQGTLEGDQAFNGQEAVWNKVGK